MRPRTPAAGLLLWLVLGGCAATTPTPGASPAAPASLPPSVTSASLARWADFPADRSPRPIVLLDPLPLAAGFADSAAKLAVAAGAITYSGPPPAAPPRTVRVDLPGGPVDLPTVTAAQALHLVTAQASAPPGASSPAPLAVTSARLVTAVFRTDQGRQVLPAWQFASARSLGPIQIPALAASAFWRLGQVHASATTSFTQGGHPAPGDTSLTISVPTPPKACPGAAVYRYDPVVRESSTAVAVGVRATVTGTAPGRPGTCDGNAVGGSDTYRVVLSVPLGQRVVVDAQGDPVPPAPGT